jgi:hypothetical protein
MKVDVKCFFKGVFYSSLAILFVSCGAELSSSDKKAATIPIPITPTVPSGYAVDPSLYTRSVASVPHGVECMDALNNAGFPDASAINIANYKAVDAVRSGQVVLNDYQASPQVVMTVIDLSSYASAVDVRLMNPNAYYCLYSSKALNSSVTVQRLCSAKMVTVFTATSQNIIPAKHGFFRTWWNRDTVSEGTMVNGNGFTELPCVQGSI